MNLRARLLGLVLVATGLPAMLLGWRFVKENDSEVATAVRSLAASAGSAAAELEHRVQGTAQLHYGLAYSRMLDTAEPTACSAYLAAVREAYPQYTGILTVRPDGQMHCDSLQSGRSLDLRDRSYVKRALAGGNALVLESVFGRLTGNSVLQVVYPARSASGGLRFLLVASLNLRKFAEDVHARSPLLQSELLLVDEGGIVMAWSGQGSPPVSPGNPLGDPALLRLARAGGTGELQGRDGRLHVWAAADSPTLRAAGLHVLLGQPRQALVAAAEQRLHQGLFVLSAAALLLFAGVWALAEWGIRSQVGRITMMVRELGRGNLDARIPLPHPRGELGGLMALFNHTADSLQRQRAAIDELAERLRVAHRRELCEREENEARLSQMANFDSLTGLPNRTLFREHLQQAMDRVRRSGRPCALMFLDIDRFKTINDSLGHHVGDQLLVAVGQALAGCLRGSDLVGRDDGVRAGDAVFRLGGDEFMILAEGVAGSEAVAAIAERVLRALAEVIVIGEHELFVSASIGITLYSGDGVDLDGLVKQADMAMYRSKALGRDTHCFFDETMNAAASRHRQLEVRLRHALQRDEFRLHYQPKADFATGRVCGVEALLRWQPEGEALVGPDQFIPILEETGLIVPVGAWVLREACSQMMRWQAQGVRPLRLAVNLSAVQLRHAGVADAIRAVLAETGVAPRQLEVELTESVLIDDSERVVEALTDLGAMGVRIAIDDFGTGQSSLRYLQRFVVDTLKIDRSFVKNTPGHAGDCAIATAVIALGHGLGLNVVAEGVETEAQRDFLKAQGCDELQGYLLSRPLPAAAFPGWLEQHQRLADAPEMAHA